MIFLLCFMFIMLPLPLGMISIQAEVYQWKDEKGAIHFTEDEASIPEQYRQQIQKKHSSDERKAEGNKVDIKSQGKNEKKKKIPQKSSLNLSRIESDAMDSFKTIILLWRDKKYDVLYEHGDRKSRMAVNKEDFERRMAKKEFDLAPSWQTINEIKVDIKSPALVYTAAKIGYRLKKGGDTKYRTETYQMILENGLWKVNLLKILNTKIG